MYSFRFFLLLRNNVLPPASVGRDRDKCRARHRYSIQDTIVFICRMPLSERRTSLPTGVKIHLSLADRLGLACAWLLVGTLMSESERGGLVEPDVDEVQC
jgi:hypothetical protein